MEQGRLWTADEVASHLRLARSTVYGLARSGELPSVRVAGRVRFRQADLQAWVELQENSDGSSGREGRL